MDKVRTLEGVHKATGENGMIQKNGRPQYRAESTLTVYEAK